jgi:hypothetical protein
MFGVRCSGGHERDVYSLLFKTRIGEKVSIFHSEIPSSQRLEKIASPIQKEGCWLVLRAGCCWHALCQLAWLWRVGVCRCALRLLAAGCGLLVWLCAGGLLGCAGLVARGSRLETGKRAVVQHWCGELAGPLGEPTLDDVGAGPPLVGRVLLSGGLFPRNANKYHQQAAEKDSVRCFYGPSSSACA